MGYGFKDVSIEYYDGETWNPVTETQFAQAPGTADYAGNDPVDLNGIVARSVRLTAQSNWGGSPFSSLSEVRFYYVPTYAWTHDPDGAYLPTDAWTTNPVDGANDVDPDAVLTWRAGREAATHEVFVGTDANDLPQVDTSTGSPFGAYDTRALDLQLSQTYYWRINEVNEGQVPSLWEGDDVQSFTVADFVVVDDFEGYTNEAETYSRVFQTWIDGAGYTNPVVVPGNGTGSYMGYDPTLGDIMETRITHGGSQSAPFSYGNGGKSTSEVTRTYDQAQDWTGHGITTLVVHFYGTPENGAAQLYVKINGTRVDYSGPADNLLRGRWTQWNIDLTGVSAAGNVNTLTLGMEGAGSQGLLLVDDILLYKVAPEIPEVAAAVDPGTDGLLAYYDMENDLMDGSGNGLDGTAVGAPTFSAGLVPYGTALSLAGADCVDLGTPAAFNPSGSFSVSLWANAEAWSEDWAHTMIGNRGEDSIGWQIRRYAGTPNIAFTTRGVGNDDMQSAAVMPIGSWVHIACVYDNAANTKQIYINGAPEQEVTTTAGVIAATTHNTYIGARATSDNTAQEAFFTGLLDEIRVYNRALSAGEVEFLSDPTP
jgi:hypothetical protein